MPKGKKFDAAEKHFKKKEEDYQRRIRNLETTLTQLRANVRLLEGKNSELITENDSLKEWVERLLTYTELSKEDIKAVCEQDKRRQEALVSLAGMTKALRGCLLY